MSKRNTPLRRGRSEGRIVVQRMARAPEVTTAQVQRAARAALGDRPMRSIDVALVDDFAIAVLHKQYMGLAGPTDVLTFDLRDDADEAEMEGEIVISVDTARRQAREWHAEATEELLRYVIHGVLHLLGYDDDTPAKRARMRREENRVLASLRLTSLKPKQRAGRHV